MPRDFDESGQAGSGTGPSRTLRGVIACTAIALSVLVHWVGLAWVALRLGVFAPPEDPADDPVEVTMVTPQPPPPSKPLPEEAAKPVPPPRARPAPKPPRKPPEPAAAAPAVPASGSAAAPDPVAAPGEPQPTLPPDAPATTADGTTGDPGDKGSPDVTEPAPAAPPEPAPLLYGRSLGDPPRSGEWPYYFHYGDYTDGGLKVAEVMLQLAYQGDSYRVRLQGEARGFYSLLPKFKGTLVFSSQGSVGPNGLMPQRYSDRRPGRDERWAAVDYEARTVNFSRNQATVPLVDGAQDLMSALWQLAMVVQAMPDKANLGETIEIPVIGSRSVDRVRFVSKGIESLATDVGPVDALHFAPSAEPATEEKLDVWLGVREGMIPVRIRLTGRRGEVFDLLWRR